MPGVLLVQFRAGKLQREGRMLKPDPRKGIIIVLRDNQGQLHFQWAERDGSGCQAAVPETDVILSPGGANFEQVDQQVDAYGRLRRVAIRDQATDSGLSTVLRQIVCFLSQIDRPGARIFRIQFDGDSDKDQFYWAQEPNAENEVSLVSRVNAAVQSQPTGREVAKHHEIAAQVIDSSQLSVALGRIFETSGLSQSRVGSITADSTGFEKKTQEDPLTLVDVLRAELISPLLDEPGLLESILPFIPEEQRSKASIIVILNSPQFKHQLGILSSALATGQLDASQFGIGTTSFGVREFLKSVESHASKQWEAENAGVEDGEGPH